MKTCIKCNTEKVLGDYYKNPNTGDGYLSWCKVCHKAYQNLRQRSARYGISPEEYAGMLAAQDDVCGICGKPESVMINGKRRELGVDHDHRCCPGQTSCGKCVRGLLCQQCNMGTGAFGDDAESVRKALDYLLRYERSVTLVAA